MIIHWTIWNPKKRFNRTFSGVVPRRKEGSIAWNTPFCFKACQSDRSGQEEWLHYRTWKWKLTGTNAMLQLQALANVQTGATQTHTWNVFLLKQFKTTISGHTSMREVSQIKCSFILTLLKRRIMWLFIYWACGWACKKRGSKCSALYSSESPPMIQFC